jgi:hypothetical protein
VPDVPAPSPRSRARHAALLVFSVLPGWLLVAGVAWPWIAPIGDGTVQTALCWFASVGVLNIGKLFVPDGDGPAPDGRILWFSGMAALLLVNRSYLEWRCREAGVPPRVVLAAAWAPWFLAVSFWIFLAGHAVIEILAD